MNHFQRHLVGYATILGAMTATALEQLKAKWPADHQEWALFGLEVTGAGCTTIIAYRSVPRTPDVFPVTPPPTLPKNS